jgi:hypothetical protein
VPVAAVSVGGGHRRRRRRRHRRRRKGDDIAVAMPTDHVCEPPTPSTAPYLSKPDPLALAMCMAVGPPALVDSFDLMLEELAAVLVVSGALEATSAEPSMAGSDATPGFAGLR